VRINSQGVKLNQADFLLTLLSVFWQEGHAALERFSRQSSVPPAAAGKPSAFNYIIQPPPDQILRISVATGFHRARLRSVYQALRGKDVESGQFSETKRDDQFARLREAQENVLNLNYWQHDYLSCLRHAGYRGAEMISSESAVIYGYAVPAGPPPVSGSATSVDAPGLPLVRNELGDCLSLLKTSSASFRTAEW
jgi:hypothetical protein